MPIQQMFEIPGNASINEKGEKLYSRKWKIQMQHIYDLPPDVWSTIPVIRYSPYPNDPDATARTLSCDPISDEIGWWEVTINYSSAAGNDGSTAVNQSGDDTDQSPANDQSVLPPDRPWVIKFGHVHREKVLGPKDFAGKPVVNSANQPYIPPVMYTSCNLTFHVTAFVDVLGFDCVKKINTFQDAVNNTAMNLNLNTGNSTTFPIYTLRCTEYAVESHTENGLAYYQVDFTIEYQREGWHPIQVLDQGTMCITSMLNPPTPITDPKTGEPVAPPGLPLNGAGAVLPADGTLVYNSFQAYNLEDFTKLLT